MVPEVRQPERRIYSASLSFIKQNRFELIKLGCFASLVLINLIALPSIKEGCKFQSTVFNSVFFYSCIIPESVLRVFFRFAMVTEHEDTMWRRNSMLKAISGILYAAFSIYVLRTFDTFTVHCYDPYPSYSLFVFAVIICFILPKAFIVCCVAAMIILFLPCIIYYGINHWQSVSQQRTMREGVIECTPKVKYSEARFVDIKQCPICMADFSDGDEVTPLPCDIRHTYHSDCIVPWFGASKVECPNCRHKLEPGEMRIHRDNIERILDNYAAEKKR